MKKLMLSVFALAVVVFSANAADGNTATTTSNADARLVSAIGVTNNAGLQFGQVSISGTAGTVTLAAAADAAPQSANGVKHLNNVTQTAAKFTVTGQAGLEFDIASDAAATLTGTPSGSLTVDLVKSASVGTIGAASDVFYIGGTLNVLAASVAGTYTGTFAVNVNYN